MTVSVERLTSWTLVANMARATMGRDGIYHEPSSDWKRRILRAEHSPIRALMFCVRMEIPYYVSVHLVRHKHGVEHYVRSQRTDRTGIPRDELPQNAPVTHYMVLNAQAIISISRKRLCCLADVRTMEVWQMVVDKLRDIGEVELADACVPECEHQGGRCPEMQGCGRYNRMAWANE